jgi:hypothetical protein
MTCFCLDLFLAQVVPPSVVDSLMAACRTDFAHVQRAARDVLLSGYSITQLIDQVAHSFAHFTFGLIEDSEFWHVENRMDVFDSVASCRAG